MFRYTEVMELHEEMFYEYLAVRRLAYMPYRKQYAVFFGKEHGSFVCFMRPYCGYENLLCFIAEDTIHREYPTDPDNTMDWTRDLIEVADLFQRVDREYLPGSFSEYIPLLNKERQKKEA